MSHDCSDDEKSIEEEPADVSLEDLPWDPSELPPDPDPPIPCQKTYRMNHALNCASTYLLTGITYVAYHTGSNANLTKNIKKCSPLTSYASCGGPWKPAGV